MNRSKTMFFAAALFVGVAPFLSAQSVKVSPASMPKTGTIDERFQSYNIEAVEITGGRFWKPFASAAAPASNAAASPGMDPSLYEYRPPLDLSNARLRKLAAALGPVYLRVSGTWMNSAWFQDSDAPAPSKPPADFNSVLTRQEWKGVVDFARAADAKIVTSFAISPGTRDAAGVWTPAQAHALVQYTHSLGGDIAAAEFMNEPTFAEIGSAPKGYDAAAYARDFAVFRKFVQSDLPHMIVIGPGGVMEGAGTPPVPMRLISSQEILAATGPAFDAFSYHSYGAVSSRCGQLGSPLTISPADALSAAWLARSGQIEAYYAGIRDRYLPGKSIWLTETAEAACGGDRWASTFLDTFRYLDQLGRLARAGVQVHMHNTLNASDYGLVDEKTYEPRPDYWAALLWHRLMGSTVLDPGSSPSPDLHLYAHCLRGVPGGVALLAINADKNATKSVEIPVGAELYTLTAPALESSAVQLNGSELRLGAGDELPLLQGRPTTVGQVVLPSASVTFLAFPKAKNASCR